MAIVIPLVMFALMLAVAALLYGGRRSAELGENRALLRRLGCFGIAPLEESDDPDPRPSRIGLPGRGPFLIFRRLEEAISKAGVEIPVGTFLLLMTVLFIIGTSLTAIRFGFGTALAAGAALESLPFLYLKFRRGQRLKIFNRQVPYVLDMLRSALESGHTLHRGLQMASENLAEPMSSEIRLVLEQVQLGRALPQALENMYRRIPEEDLGFLVVAVKIQSEVGSSLAEILQHVTTSVRNRQRLKDQIQTLTAQSRMSALIVTTLPAVILLAFTFIRPGYADPLFFDPVGIKLLETAIILDVLALFLMRRIARVRY